MSTTINNGIPFVPENTNDPAAGLNLSINQIDALLQTRVHSVGANTPPAGVEGQRHIVGIAPTGVWAGQANKLARYLDGAWTFYDARIVLATDGNLHIRPNLVWSVISASGGSVDWGAIGGALTDQLDLVGALQEKEQVLAAGANITIDRTDPENPVISASGSLGMDNPMTAAGDIIRGGDAGAPERLPVGTAGQVLTVVAGVPAWTALTQAVAPVVADSSTARTFSLADASAYVRFTNASATTATVPPQSSVAWAANAEIHIRRAAAGNLTIAAGAGVTLNAPSGGTLVMTNAMSITLKRVASDVWDVIGQTVAA